MPPRCRRGAVPPRCRRGAAPRPRRDRAEAALRPRRRAQVYDEVAKVVEPKKEALARSTAQLEEEQAKLKGVRDELAMVIAKVEELQATCDRTVDEKKRLQEAAETTSKRLARAGKLTGGLADESVRWAATVEDLTRQREELTGDGQSRRPER